MVIGTWKVWFVPHSQRFGFELLRDERLPSSVAAPFPVLGPGGNPVGRRALGDYKYISLREFESNGVGVRSRSLWLISESTIPAALYQCEEAGVVGSASRTQDNRNVRGFKKNSMPPAADGFLRGISTSHSAIWPCYGRCSDFRKSGRPLHTVRPSGR